MTVDPDSVYGYSSCCCCCCCDGRPPKCDGRSLEGLGTRGDATIGVIFERGSARKSEPTQPSRNEIVSAGERSGVEWCASGSGSVGPRVSQSDAMDAGGACLEWKRRPAANERSQSAATCWTSQLGMGRYIEISIYRSKWTLNRGNCPASLNFVCWNFFVVEYSSKNTIFGAKNPQFGRI